MMNEDIAIAIATDDIYTVSLDDEIVDLSEEIYPVSNQNNSNQNNSNQTKKGWIKTLLFM